MSLLEFTETAVLDELVEIVSEMLDGIMEASVPEGYIQPAPAFQAQSAQATVPILGPDQCTLTIRLQASVAVGLAAALIEEDPSELEAEDACAVLSELSNVLGGSVKTLLEEETSLGIPEAVVKDTNEFEILEDSVFVDHPLGSFQVRLGR